MIDYRVLGTPVKNTETCSKCAGAIPDEHVPLILWADGRNLMWVFCENCEEGMFAMLEFNKPRPVPR